MEHSPVCPHRSFRPRRASWPVLLVLPLVLLTGCATDDMLQPSPTGFHDPVMFQYPEAPPPPPPSKTAAHVSLTGSLWAAEGNESLYRDIKARRIGDILTIMVSEESEASKTADTETGRDKDVSGSAEFDGLTIGPKVRLKPISTEYGAKAATDFTGTGSTTKKDSMKAYMSARVVAVLGNGNLAIRGSRWTKVNHEMQQIVLEGVVRPNDITRDNTVLSQNIADAKIFFVGKGPVTQHQRPGWLARLYDVIAPF